MEFIAGTYETETGEYTVDEDGTHSFDNSGYTAVFTKDEMLALEAGEEVDDFTHLEDNEYDTAETWVIGNSEEMHIFYPDPTVFVDEDEDEDE